jgi:AcrR family transcriptional regulator
MPASRRDQLLDSATALFDHEGFHTGIDRLVEAAGVARMTLYNQFASKDGLVLAVLRRRDEQVRSALARDVERRAVAPRARLLAVFDALDAWFRTPDFHGCLFIKAAAEHAQAGAAVRTLCAAHKRRQRDWLEGLARDAGAPDPAALAAQLAILVEGAIVSAQVGGDRHAAAVARSVAATLLATMPEPTREQDPASGVS